MFTFSQTIASEAENDCYGNCYLENPVDGDSPRSSPVSGNTN